MKLKGEVHHGLMMLCEITGNQGFICGTTVFKFNKISLVITAHSISFSDSRKIDTLFDNV